MPLDLTEPGTFIGAARDGDGYARAELPASPGFFWEDADGDALAIADAWIERIVYTDDSQEDLGRANGSARPSWFQAELAPVADGPGGESRYLVDFGLSDATLVGASIAKVAFGLAVTDGENETEAAVWVYSSLAAPGPSPATQFYRYTFNQNTVLAYDRDTGLTTDPVYTVSAATAAACFNASGSRFYFVTDAGQVRRINRDGTGETLINTVAGLSGAIGDLIVDEAAGFAFVVAGNTYKVPLDGSATSQIFTNTLAGNIDADRVNQRLYLILQNAVVRALTYNGASVYNSDVGGGDAGIAVDPAAGYVFFSASGQIKRSDLAFGNLTTIATDPSSDSFKYPKRIAIDPVAQRVYYGENLTHDLIEIGYDGSGRTVIDAGNDWSNIYGILAPPGV